MPTADDDADDPRSQHHSSCLPAYCYRTTAAAARHAHQVVQHLPLLADFGAGQPFDLAEVALDLRESTCRCESKSLTTCAVRSASSRCCRCSLSSMSARTCASSCASDSPAAPRRVGARRRRAQLAPSPRAAAARAPPDRLPSPSAGDATLAVAARWGRRRRVRRCAAQHAERQPGAKDQACRRRLRPRGQRPANQGPAPQASGLGAV